MSEFLESVQATSSLGDPDLTLDAVRGVFYALLLGAGNRHVREASDHLPEELETLWKPALFACLREEGDPAAEGGTGDAPGPEAFANRVRRQAPELDGEGVEKVTRAVLQELRSRISARARSELARGLPAHLRDDWTG